jgi:recombination protein RecR
VASLPQPVVELLAALNKLPGIGPRSAERIALHLVQSDPGTVRQLAEVLVHARERVRHCENCGALTEQSPCSICADPRRDDSIVCVVERPVDILSIEKAGSYRGKFHVLGGKISPLNGVGPEDLNIGGLESRLTRESKKSSWPCQLMWKVMPPVPTFPNA